MNRRLAAGDHAHGCEEDVEQKLLGRAFFHCFQVFPSVSRCWQYDLNISIIGFVSSFWPRCGAHRMFCHMPQGCPETLASLPKPGHPLHAAGRAWTDDQLK